MNRFCLAVILGLALLIPLTTFAAPMGDATSRLASFDQQVISEVWSHRALPKQGWIEGSVGTRVFNITFDRLAWTIIGQAGNQPVNIQIDHAAKTIRGSAHGEVVDLGFTWSPQEVTLAGEAYGLPYLLSANWPSGTANGKYAYSLLELQFDLHQGTLTGNLGGKLARLNYDRVSGRVSGDLFRQPVNLKLTNLDFTDFIHHLYLFVK